MANWGKNSQLLNDDELNHHGILGMKWGVRRYQNKDGSLTSAGRRHYRANAAKTLGAGSWYSLNKKYSEKSIRRMLDNVNNNGMTIKEAKKKERVRAMGRIIGKTAIWAAITIPTLAYLNSPSGQKMMLSAIKAANSKKNDFDDLTDVLVRKSSSAVKKII